MKGILRREALRRYSSILAQLLALLILTGCTNVTDFGVYWDRGTLDPELAGRWKKIGLPGEPIDSIPGADLVAFTSAGTFYSLQLINPIDPKLDSAERARRAKDNAGRFEAKTLRIGNRNVLMVREGGTVRPGAIDRYDIQGGVLEEWWLLEGNAKDWLESKHPHVPGIRLQGGIGAPLIIEKLDEGVVRVLAEMLNDPSLWVLNCRYRKLSQ